MLPDRPSCFTTRRTLAAAFFFCALTLTALEAAGQRTTVATDPLSVARSMFAAREPATNVATVLKGSHGQGDVSTASVMRTAGYDAVAIAGALKSAFASTGIQAYNALKQAGFGTTTISNALSASGIPVGMDCIDQQNEVVPCGTFGGMTNTPVMGQVTWSPKAQGYVDSTLTISGTNIPVVEVRLGSQVLTQISAHSAKVVVALPDQPTQGPLTMRRVSDGVEGKMENMYHVVAAPAAIDWPALATAAIIAATEDARHWLAGAKIEGAKCTVNSAWAHGIAGVFGTATDFQGAIKSALLQAGAPNEVATAWDSGFRAAWWLWASNVTIPGLPWYPTFDLVPSSAATATQNPPTPLGLLVSSKVAEMSPALLAARIKYAIAPAQVTPAADAAITSFAATMSTKFAAFLLIGMVTNVQGSGNVPSYDPPKVPAGKVVNGTCSGLNVLALAASSF